MKPRPIRMPDALWEKLQAEAEAEDRSTAEHVRAVLRQHVDPDTQANTQADTQPDTQAITSRLDELEERVADLENSRDERTAATSEATQRETPAGRDDQRLTSDENPESDATDAATSADVSAAVEDVVTADLERITERDVPQLRPLVATIVEDLADGPLSKAELKDRYYAQADLGVAEATWYKKVRSALAAHPEVEPPGEGRGGEFRRL